MLIRYRTNPCLHGFVVSHGKKTDRVTHVGDKPFEFLTYQLLTVMYWITVAMTGNRKLGFDSGEGP